MVKRRKAWSKAVVEFGVRVRLFERGGTIYREVRDENGKDRRSLKHGDRDLAEKQAKALCREIATLRLTGATASTLTLAQLHTIYLQECGQLLTAGRQRDVDKAFGLWKRHVGGKFAVADLGPHQVQTYVAARQAGTLPATGGRHGGKAVRAGTIAKEMGVMHAALNWAATYRRAGKPLISHNPIRGVATPSEPNPARPVATRDRFEKMVEQADKVDRRGAFRAMLQLAWYTGRRLGSIVALQASDILLTSDQVRRALATAGMEEYLAEEWPAAIRWDAAADKEGVEWIIPIPEVLRASVTDYIRARGLVGGALLFPSRRDATKPLSKETAYYWMRQAEKLAGLPHQTRGGWHMFRRSWATARKHLPLQDVMAAGGWRDPAALQRAYQHPDPQTVRAVMELS